MKISVFILTRQFQRHQTLNMCKLKKPRKFLHLKYDNKGIDAVNINILNHKNVQSCIPPYFKMKSTPYISYRYTSTIASKLFNHKQTLQCLDIEQLRQNPLKCSCSSSPFNYSPAGHIITGDVNIVQNEDLRSLILKGPKFREPRSFISCLSWIMPDVGLNLRERNLTLCLNGLTIFENY